LKSEKYDTKRTYKKFLRYSPGVGVICGLVVGIENRDGNANGRFHQQDTLNGFGWHRLPKSFMNANAVFFLGRQE